LPQPVFALLRTCLAPLVRDLFANEKAGGLAPAAGKDKVHPENSGDLTKLLCQFRKALHQAALPASGVIFMDNTLRGGSVQLANRYKNSRFGFFPVARV
jgi:hypothetical protein